jgi:hypothetical protein
MYIYIIYMNKYIWIYIFMYIYIERRYIHIYIYIYMYINIGFLSFWTGFGAYYMRTAPHAMILLMTTQPITNYYKKHIIGSQ